MIFAQNPELFTVIFIVTIESFLIITYNIKFAYDKTIKVIFKNNDAPNFPENYIRNIVSLAREGYIVLISSHKEVRDELNKRSSPFTIVLPSLDMKQEMIDRYIKRGNQENFVTMLENNYETFVNDLMSDPNNKIVLDSGQYLKDVMRFI